VPTIKLTLFIVSKDEWDTKEGPGKSMKNELYVKKAPLGLKQHQTVKKIKPVALAMQLVSQSVSQEKILLNNSFFKFRSNFLKAFRVDLKGCLGLVLPNQCCPIVIRKIVSDFRLWFILIIFFVFTMNHYCGS